MQMLQALGAERAVLAILMKKPELFFSINDIINEGDFTNIGNKLIFSIMKDIVEKDKDCKLDHFVIISRAEQKGIDDFLRHTQNGELLEALETTKASVNIETINKHVHAVKDASVRRNLIDLFSNMRDEVEEFQGTPSELRESVEQKILGTTRLIDNGPDGIENLSDNFEATINELADRTVPIGINIGFPRYQRDCGQVRNGTVTGIFARAKAGKSQLATFSVHNVSIAPQESKRLPSLILDTELQTMDQQMRLCGMMTGIPYEVIEAGTWKSNKEQVKLMKEAFAKIKKAPVYYKNIAGKSINHVIPIMRKFVHNILGGPQKENKTPRGLIVYDYIKLMNAKDIAHAKEYEMLNFLLSQLHDAAIDLNVPVLAFGQLNREAFKSDSEQAVAGTDRINWNLDSVSILRKKKPEEIEVDGQQRGNYILKVLLARRGPGHDDEDWINLHFAKNCGQFREDKRQSEVSEAISQIDGVRERLAADDIRPIGDVDAREEI
jgi:replicative DNA helicase